MLQSEVGRLSSDHESRASVGADARQELARSQLRLPIEGPLSGCMCELERWPGLLQMADEAGTSLGSTAGRTGIPTAHGGRVGVRLPWRQQREPLFLVGQ